MDQILPVSVTNGQDTTFQQTSQCGVHEPLDPVMGIAFRYAGYGDDLGYGS